MDEGLRNRMAATRSYLAILSAEAEQQQTREARAHRIEAVAGLWLRRAAFAGSVLASFIAAACVGTVIGDALARRIWLNPPLLRVELPYPANPGAA